GSLRPHGTARGRPASGSRSDVRRSSRLPAEGAFRRGAMWLSLQGASDRARSPWRGALSPTGTRPARVLRALPGPRAPAFGRGKLHPRPPPPREPAGNRLVGRRRAVLAFANVMDLFTHELAGLCRRRLARSPVAPRAPQRFLFWHGFSCAPTRRALYPSGCRTDRSPQEWSSP